MERKGDLTRKRRDQFATEMDSEGASSMDCDCDNSGNATANTCKSLEGRIFLVKSMITGLHNILSQYQIRK